MAKPTRITVLPSPTGRTKRTRKNGKSEQHSPRYTTLNMLSDLSDIGEICKVDLEKKLVLPIDDLESEKCDLDHRVTIQKIVQKLSEDSNILRKKKVSRKFVYEVGPVIKSLENTNLF